MKVNDKRVSNSPSPARTAPLKGSDFFPPGAGWNHAKKPDETGQDYSADKQHGEHRKH